jgi:hypothetical protein
MWDGPLTRTLSRVTETQSVSSIVWGGLIQRAITDPTINQTFLGATTAKQKVSLSSDLLGVEPLDRILLPTVEETTFLIGSALYCCHDQVYLVTGYLDRSSVTLWRVKPLTSPRDVSLSVQVLEILTLGPRYRLCAEDSQNRPGWRHRHLQTH